MNSYKKHAYIWDWDDFGKSEEYEYWCQYASTFGSSALLPMCALARLATIWRSTAFR